MTCPIIIVVCTPHQYVNVPAWVNWTGLNGVPGEAAPVTTGVLMNMAFGLVPTTECGTPMSSFIHWMVSQTWMERTCPLPPPTVVGSESLKSQSSVWTVPAPAAHVPAPPLLLAAVALLLAAVALLLAAVVLLLLAAVVLLVAPPSPPPGVELLELHAPTKALAPTTYVEARTSAYRMAKSMVPLHVDRNWEIRRWRPQPVNAPT